jgi:hypothetical protein
MLQMQVQVTLLLYTSSVLLYVVEEFKLEIISENRKKLASEEMIVQVESTASSWLLLLWPEFDLSRKESFRSIHVSISPSDETRREVCYLCALRRPLPRRVGHRLAS